MLVDFRSDTVTKPSREMRDFMAQAPVGDDVFQEDPTINKLEKFAASLFGKEAALYCSSGTQTNQIAINVHCSPGEEVICSNEAHIYIFEGGGIAKNSGASTCLIEGDRGRINAKDVEKRIRNPNNIHFPKSALVSIEDTTNIGGGAFYDFKEIKAIRKVCNKHHLPLHLDGARLFNALTENKISKKEYAAQFDSISICLSKGLGAPVGSLLLGKKEFIHSARRVRKVFGGGMRQAGIIAAGGLFALQNNVDRLKIDHQHAKELETVLNQSKWVKEVTPVETNIVVAELTEDVNTQAIIKKCQEKKVRFLDISPKKIRMVTHLDISEEDLEYAIGVFKSI